MKKRNKWLVKVTGVLLAAVLFWCMYYAGMNSAVASHRNEKLVVSVSAKCVAYDTKEYLRNSSSIFYLDNGVSLEILKEELMESGFDEEEFFDRMEEPMTFTYTRYGFRFTPNRCLVGISQDAKSLFSEEAGRYIAKKEAQAALVPGVLIILLGLLYVIPRGCIWVLNRMDKRKKRRKQKPCNFWHFPVK